MHHANRFKAFADANRVRLKYLPKLSSILNPIEKVWGTLKLRWSRLLASTNTTYIYANIDVDLRGIMRSIGESLSPTILNVCDDYLQKCMRGILV